jgi:TonB family protein
VDLRDASVAIGYDARGRCPDLLQADPQDNTAALVVLMVGPSGVPSQPAIKSSSGSESLDAAALSCVMRLRFLPAVHAGEGLAVASWQEIAWKWGRGHLAPGAAAAAAPGAAASPSAPTAAVSPGPSRAATTSGPAVAAATMTAGSTLAAAAPAAVPGPSPVAAGGAEVRVCADETGKLTQAPVITRSSGDPALDQAAVRVAGSGAPYYRPAAAAAVSGCARLAIKFETK